MVAEIRIVEYLTSAEVQLTREKYIESLDLGLVTSPERDRFENLFKKMYQK